MIKQLSQQTSQDLCAQQVITSLPDSIKQLIDNSIDAKATYIKVVLYQYGKNKVEVVDNGMGIDSFDFLGKKGTTSKNRVDQRIDFLGFRGQAVHSIGKVSGDMVIESKCSKDGHRRIFNVVTHNLQQFTEPRLCHSEFNFINPNRQGSRNTGTKVSITRIFERLPVRQLELQSKFKDFLKRTNELIKEFCLIYPEIQFIFINNREGKDDILIETSCYPKFDRLTWLQRITQIDEKLAKSMVYVSGHLFEGFVLKKIESGSSRQNAFLKKNQHYCFVNRRPIDPLPALVSNLNDIYKKYNNNTKYAFVLNLKLQHDQIDLNLTPNKREIFVRKNTLEKIVQGLKEEIGKKVIEEIPTLGKIQNKEEEAKKNGQTGITNYLESKVMVNNIDSRRSVFIPEVEAPLKEEPPNRLSSIDFNTERRTFPTEQPKLDIKPSSKVHFDDIDLPKMSIDRQKLKSKLSSINTQFSGIKRTSSGAPRKSTTSHDPVSSGELELAKKKGQQLKRRHEQQDAKRRVRFMQEMNEVKLEQNEEPLVTKPTYVIPKQKPNIAEQHMRKEQNKAQIAEENQQQEKQQEGGEPRSKKYQNRALEQRIKSKLSINMTDIFDKFKASKQNPPQPSQPSQPAPPIIHQQMRPQSKAYPQEQMDTSLNAQLGDMAPRSIKKHDFQHFDILGQFNKGFIICEFQKKFYMVDQHAADEKYQYQLTIAKSKNFECINCFQEKEVTSIQIDEIEQAAQYLESAGYHYEVVDGNVLKLKRCPIFRNKKLGMQYFEEIVTQKKPIETTQQFNNMCAMIACKSAIKVGQTLRPQQMWQVVNNLSTLASPWNCPHGRPTLIELGSTPTLINAGAKRKQYLI